MNTKLLSEDSYIVLVIVAGAVVCAGGYVTNLYKLVHASDGLLAAALRLIGVFFPPLGVLLGFV